VLNKFMNLSTIKKATIIFALIVAFFVLAPLTVKVASAGEIDLYAMLQGLFTRVDDQEARIAELESKLSKYELQENKEPENEEKPASVKDNNDPEAVDTSSEGSTGGYVAPDDKAATPAGDNYGEGESPAPESEPEPLPSLAKIDYFLTPQRSDSGRFEYVFQGTAFDINQDGGGKAAKCLGLPHQGQMWLELNVSFS